MAPFSNTTRLLKVNLYPLSTFPVSERIFKAFIDSYGHFLDEKTFEKGKKKRKFWKVILSNPVRVIKLRDFS